MLAAKLIKLCIIYQLSVAIVHSQLALFFILVLLFTQTSFSSPCEFVSIISVYARNTSHFFLNSNQGKDVTIDIQYIINY